MCCSYVKIWCMQDDTAREDDCFMRHMSKKKRATSFSLKS